MLQLIRSLKFCLIITRKFDRLLRSNIWHSALESLNLTIVDDVEMFFIDFIICFNEVKGSGHGQQLNGKPPKMQHVTQTHYACISFDKRGQF